MEWILFISLQWIVSGSATPPNTDKIERFASEEQCKAAADAIRTEFGTVIPGQRAQTLVRAVCIGRK